jgi:hypothetical protein
MDHPLSHQVLVNRQMRTPIDSSLARSHYKKICKTFCWNQWPMARLESLSDLETSQKVPRAVGFIFAKLVHPS